MICSMCVYASHLYVQYVETGCELICYTGGHPTPSDQRTLQTLHVGREADPEFINFQGAQDQFQETNSARL
jgi:hypothetical protein